MSVALSLAALLLALVGAWAALPTAPRIVARSVRAWFRRRFAGRPEPIHRASGGAAFTVTVRGTAFGYAPPLNVRETVDLLWRWAEENRTEHREMARRLDTAEQRLREHDQRFESEGAAHRANLDRLRRDIEREQHAGLRVNAHAFPAVVLAILIDGTATWLVGAPFLAWLALVIAAVVIVPTFLSGRDAYRRDRASARAASNDGGS